MGTVPQNYGNQLSFSSNQYPGFNFQVTSFEKQVLPYLLGLLKLDWILIRMMDVHSWDISGIGTTHSLLKGA